MSTSTPLAWLSTSASNACDPAIHSLSVPLAKKPPVVETEDEGYEPRQDVLVATRSNDSDHGKTKGDDGAVVSPLDRLDSWGGEKRVRFKGEGTS